MFELGRWTLVYRVLGQDQERVGAAEVPCSDVERCWVHCEWGPTHQLLGGGLELCSEPGRPAPTQSVETHPQVQEPGVGCHARVATAGFYWCVRFDKHCNFTSLSLVLEIWPTLQSVAPSILVPKRRTPGFGGSSSTAATTWLSQGQEMPRLTLSICRCSTQPMIHNSICIFLWSWHFLLW